MIEWQDLVKRLMLGSEALSSPLVSSQKSVQEFYDSLLPLPPEAQLMHALGGMQWMRKLGLTFDMPEGLHELPVTAESRPVCPPALSRLMTTALQAGQVAFLHEAGRCLNQTQCRLPGALLVDWLTLAARSPALRTLDATFLGERGTYLIHANPDWSSLLSMPGIRVQPPVAMLSESEAAWDGLSGEARWEYWAQLRAQCKPDEIASFHGLLQQQWTTWPARDRQKLLESLAPFWTMEDGEFLASCAQDRSLLVRQQAKMARLRLGFLADQQPLLTCLQGWLTFDKGSLLQRASLTVRYPDEFDKTWEEWGVKSELSYLPLMGRVGRKSAWLYQMLARVSPSALCAAFRMEPRQWLKLLQSHEAGPLLHMAWMQAALFYQDSEALLAGLQALNSEQQTEWLHAEIGNVSSSLFTPIFAYAIKTQKAAQLIRLLIHLPEKLVLSESLSLQVAQCLSDWVAEEGAVYSHLHRRLESLAFAFALPVLCSVIELLERTPNERLDNLVRWLRYRYQLHQECIS
ncbi:MAG: hypothetical protein H7A00_15950 [Hahellaceae bacterium]|nr:hypothetical protein [Hahellaceae bacterium]